MKKILSRFILLFATLITIIPFICEYDEQQEKMEQKVKINIMKKCNDYKVIKAKREKDIVTFVPIEVKNVNNIPTNAKLEYDKKILELEFCQDKIEWYMEYKEIIKKYTDYLQDKKDTIYEVFTKDEINLLFKVVQAEIGDEYSFEQKCNVASVIYNRVGNIRFNSPTLQEVLVANQFESISDGRYKKVKVSDKTVLACEYAYEIQNTARDCTFFDSNGKLNYKRVFNDGAHNFYKLSEEYLNE